MSSAAAASSAMGGSGWSGAAVGRERLLCCGPRRVEVGEAFDVLAGGDEQLAGVLGGDAEQADRAWRGDRDERGKMSVEHFDLAFELAYAFGDAAECELGRLQRLVQSRPVGPQPQAER